MSLLFGFGHSFLWEFSTLGPFYTDDGSFTDANELIIKILLFGITLLGILLSLILIGLGSVVKALQKIPPKTKGEKGLEK